MDTGPTIQLHNIDCMEYMATLPDKAFDLAIVDPPYGIGMDGGLVGNHNACKATSYEKKQWDRSKPTADYFNKLRRVSRHQIVWGANHFISALLLDSPSWVVWDKDRTGRYADCELAWTSHNKTARMFTWRWNGMLQGDMKNKETRIHPTQKPVALYKWLLKNYAEPGDRILDTHLGSGSIAIACHDMGFDLVGCEIDEDYIQAARKRLADHQSQLRLL